MIKWLFVWLIWTISQGGMFAKTEMSQVLTEIIKMDSDFTKEEFLRLCQFDFIPNILEVILKSAFP